MQKILYLLTKREADTIYRFTPIERVICTLARHKGRYVRYDSKWYLVHEIEEFDLLIVDVKRKKGTAEFIGGSRFNINPGQSLPFIDPSIGRSPGVYPQAFQ